MNVNVTYSGYTLADAASCVMMRLPVPDLVWDMEALWKVWNEPLPAVDVPEVPPEPLPEVPVMKSKKPVGCHRAVTYAGKEYPDVKSLAEAYHLNYKTCFARLRDGVPLDAPINRHPLPYRGKPVTIDGTEYPSTKDAAKALGIPYTTLCSRIRKGQDLSMPKYADRCEAVRQAVTALPPKSNRYADEGNGRRLRDCPCELDGRQYTSLDTMAVILDITDGEAYRQVMERGKFLKGRVK